MNKRSVLRTVFITAVLAMLMSISVWASKEGVQLKFNTDISVEATDNTMLHKLVLNRDGMVTILGLKVVKYTYSPTSYSGMYFTLLNSGKRAISSSTYVNSLPANKKYSYYAARFALKTGTYYVQVDGTKQYLLKAGFSAVNDQGKPKKKKGTSLKRGKTLSALFGAGESIKKVEWFKIKVKKNRKLHLTANSYGDATFRIYLYGPKPYKKGDIGTSLYSDDGWTVTYGIQRGLSRKLRKLKKGTYYVKVVRTNKDSGYCTLKWK